MGNEGTYNEKNGKSNGLCFSLAKKAVFNKIKE
jgi:hypothetical protein